MMPKQEIYEMIDSYLEGGMSVTERNSFEKMIQSDPELAKEVDAFRLANAVVSDFGLVQLRGKLDKIHHEHTGGGSGGGSGIGTAWIAGVVTLLISVSGIVTYQYLKPESTVVETKEVVVIESPKTIKEAPQEVNVPEKESPVVENSDLPQKPVTTPQPSEKKREKIVDCNSVYITGEARITEACYGSADGRIKIDQGSLQGGKAPYRYSLDNKEYRKDNVFSGLSAGNYTIYVQDKNSCISKLTEVEVKSRACKSDQAFDPDKEQWSVPIEKGLSGQLVVFNNKGNAVYKSNFEAGGNVVWNGKTTTGADLPAGNYGFDVQYSNGTSRGGTVTLLK